MLCLNGNSAGRVPVLAARQGIYGLLPKMIEFPIYLFSIFRYRYNAMEVKFYRMMHVAERRTVEIFRSPSK